MPLDVTIESLDGEFSKDIKVKTCPKRITGNYKVENWKQSKDRWAHLKNLTLLNLLKMDLWIC